MKRECITEGPTVEDAIDAALEELGVQQDAVDYEILDEPAKKMFGLGSERPARVRVWVKDAYLREIEEARSVANEVLEVEEAEEAEGEAPAPGQSFEEAEELSDEELDRVADAAVDAIQKILGAMELEASIEEYEGDDGEIILDIVGPDLAVLIGRHGRTLDAMQAVVSAITNRTVGFRYPVVVDVEGYRNRRREKLEAMARRTADRAARQHTPVRMRPMNAYERRVVHVALRDDKRVVTASEGVDPNRQVVVKPR